MIRQFNSGQILKGSDVEIVVPLATCRLDVDVREAQDLVVSIYTTPGGASIQKTIEDIELNEKGDAGLIHIEWEELDGLDDGVVRYNVFYVYDGDAVEFEGSTGYFLKTPIDYTPTTFVSEENLDELVEDKLIEEGTATEDYVDSVIAEATSGLASETYVDNAVSGLASEAYVNSAITEATSGAVSEEFVLSAISANDWAFVIHYPFVQSEIDAAVNAARASFSTPGRGKMVVFYQAGADGSFVPFYPLSPYHPYDDHDEYFWGINNFLSTINTMLLGLDEGQIPEGINSNLQSIGKDIDTLIAWDDLKTINGESIITDYYGQNLDVHEILYINGTGDTDGAHTVCAKMLELIGKNESPNRIGIVFNDGGEVPQKMLYIPWNVELNEDDEPSWAAYAVGTSNINNNKIKLAGLSVSWSGHRPIIGHYENVVDLQTFATTAQTAALEQQIQNIPSSSAITQEIQSAITASNLVYAMTNTNKIWAGTRAAYSAQTIDNTTLYFIID